MEKAPVSVIILTYNEEANIRACLESIQSLTEEVFLVDSFSTDKTLEIAREYTEHIFQNPWSNYARQRQWALEHLPFKHDWIFFLDADERFTKPVINEITQVVNNEMQQPHYGGYYVPRKFLFLGRQIRYGGCQGGLKELRLCNRHHLSIGERAGHEVYVSNKEVSSLKEPFIHEDQKPLSAWIDRHNRYSNSRAAHLWNLQNEPAEQMQALSFSVDRKLYLKEKFRQKVWHKLPLGMRPALSFIIQYVFRFGFLDGIAGFIYHFLHAFWYPLLIDAKVLELKRNKNSLATKSITIA
jgi:glycosyltransferase involved in cell wall biosynthesis